MQPAQGGGGGGGAMPPQQPQAPQGGHGGVGRRKELNRNKNVIAVICHKVLNKC